MQLHSRHLLVIPSLFLTHFIIKLVAALIKFRKVSILLKNYPTVAGNWLFGVSPLMAKNMYRLQDWRLEELGKDKTKQFQTMVISPGVSLVTIDPVVIKHILKDRFDIWTKSETDTLLLWDLFEQWIGRGIFLAPHGRESRDKGHLWEISRKTAASIFTRNNFRELMTNTFVENSKIFIEVLKKVFYFLQ
eukprot:c16480_g1_i2.p1 GENE.c16480_g1_i2~~c16480_g1_i2.p1  ORF type:complete len:190 (-),score=53.44 c16480_g1_i2:55-624(-)